MSIKLKSNELTSRELELIFNVTTRTIVNYRIGSTRISELPFHVRAGNVRDKIYYKWGEVKSWASKNKIPVIHPRAHVVALRKTRNS